MEYEIIKARLDERSSTVLADDDSPILTEIRNIIDFLIENGFTSDGWWYKLGILDRLLEKAPEFPEALLLQKSFMMRMLACFSECTDVRGKCRIFKIVQNAVIQSRLLYHQFMEMNATGVLIEMLSLTSEESQISQIEVNLHYLNALVVIGKVTYMEGSSLYLVESGLLEAVLKVPWTDKAVVGSVLEIIDVFINCHDPCQIAPFVNSFLEGTLRSWRVPEFAVEIGNDFIVPVLSDLCFNGFTGEVLSEASPEEFTSKLPLKEFEHHFGAIARLLAQFVLYNRDITSLIPIDVIMTKLISERDCSKVTEDLFVLIGAIAKQGMFMHLCCDQTLSEFIRMYEMNFHMSEYISTILWIAFVGLETYGERMTLISAFAPIMRVRPNEELIPELNIDDLVMRVLDGITELHSHGELNEPTCAALAEFLSNIADDGDCEEQISSLLTVFAL